MVYEKIWFELTKHPFRNAISSCVLSWGSVVCHMLIAILPILCYFIVTGTILYRRSSILKKLRESTYCSTERQQKKRDNYRRARSRDNAPNSYSGGSNMVGHRPSQKMFLRGFLQPLQTNAKIVPLLDHDRFALDHFQFVILPFDVI
jgi:hypothetical protein